MAQIQMYMEQQIPRIAKKSSKETGGTLALPDIRHHELEYWYILISVHAGQWNTIISMNQSHVEVNNW